VTNGPFSSVVKERMICGEATGGHNGQKSRER
jgi:hypothetical protein